MLPTHRDLIVSLSSEWKRIQRSICAHKRHRARDESLRDWLNLGTIVSAAVTALSSGLGANKMLTVVASILTTVLAMSEKTFAPTKSIQSHWKTERELDTAKHDLVNQLLSLDKPAAVMKALEQISKNTFDAGVGIVEIDKDRLEAEREFEGSMLYCRLEATSNSREGSDDAGVPYDAPGVIAVGRRGRR